MLYNINCFNIINDSRLIIVHTSNTYKTPNIKIRLYSEDAVE